MALQMHIGNDRILVGPTDPSTGEPDLDWLAEQMKGSKNIAMVTVTNPGNPTGTTLSPAVCQRLVNLTAAHGAWMVWDCTYEDFVYTKEDDDDTDQQHRIGWPAPHCLHIFSFSKAYSLAGYRCGYLAVPNHSNNNDHLWPALLKVQDTIPICPSRISQVAALGALDAGPEWVRRHVQTLAPSRAAVECALRESGAVARVLGGSGALYLMAQLLSRTKTVVDDRAVAEALVRDHGVAVIPGSFCGAPGWIRVCFANLPPDACAEAAQRLQTGLAAVVLRV